MTIILGLCCISKTLQDQKTPVKCRVIQRKYYNVKKAIETAKENLEDIIKLVKYCIEHKIYSIRLPSEILPRYTDKDVQNYSIDQFQPYFSKIGALAEKYNIRLSFHPDQFVVLSSDDPRIINSSTDELSYQCEMLSRMGVPPEFGVCNIHGGGVYGLEKSIVKQRWAENYAKLPEHVRRYLTLENDEKSYSLEDCLDISDLCGVPVVYDSFHEECYRANAKRVDETFTNLEILIHRAIKTWNVVHEGVTYNKFPMCHVSNQKVSKLAPEKIGAHSDFIDRFPDSLIFYAELCQEMGNPLYVDVEAKYKDLAIFELRNKFPEIMI